MLMLEIERKKERKKERRTCLNRGFEQHNEKGMNDTRILSFLLILYVFENDIRIKEKKAKEEKENEISSERIICTYNNNDD
jgi:hypothetical protein